MGEIHTENNRCRCQGSCPSPSPYPLTQFHQLTSFHKSRTRGVVFLAWGSPAAKRIAKVDRNRHKVLQSVHPSPLSAHRGFFECGHFKKANEWLEQRYTVDGVIDWNLGGKFTPISKGPVSKPTEDNPERDEDMPLVNGAAAAATAASTTNGKEEEGLTSSPGSVKLNAADTNNAAANGGGGVEDEDDDAIAALNEIAAHADAEKETATAAAAEMQNGQEPGSGGAEGQEADELPVVAAEDVDSNTSGQQGEK